MPPPVDTFPSLTGLLNPPPTKGVGAPGTDSSSVFVQTLVEKLKEESLKTTIPELSKLVQPKLVSDIVIGINTQTTVAQPAVVQPVDLSTSEYIPSIINLARTFIFDGIREYVNIVFFIIDSIHDNFSSRVSGLSNVIHSIIKEIQEFDKSDSATTFDWDKKYGTLSSSKESTTQFYHYLMGNSEKINKYLDELFTRLKSSDGSSINSIKLELQKMFKTSFDDLEGGDDTNETLINNFLKIYTGSFRGKLSDASAKKALAELMKSDKCGINISDSEIENLPLHHFLETWDIEDISVALLSYFVNIQIANPDGEYQNYLTGNNIKTVESIVKQQRINIVRDTVAACNTDITDTVRTLSIKVRELLHTESHDSIQIDDDKIDIVLVNFIANDTNKYIARLHKSANGDQQYQTDKDICTDLQRLLFNMGANHYNKMKCKCTKCGKTDFYSKFPIKTINYSKLWMSGYEVKDTETTGGWSVESGKDDGAYKKVWRLETYMALLLANRVLMSGSNVIDMKTSGYAKCVKGNNIGFISDADFISEKARLKFTQTIGMGLEGRELWLQCDNEIEALANARYSIKTWQQDSGYIFPINCIFYIKNGKPTKLVSTQNIVLSNENTIKNNNVDIAVMLNFYCKIIETVSSAVQFDQAGTSTDDLKRKNMVLFYFFNGYTIPENNKMLKDDYKGVLSGIDGFGVDSYSDADAAGKKPGIMEWWETTLYTKNNYTVSKKTDTLTKIPTGPKLTDGSNLEIAGWKTRMKHPYSLMTWYTSAPDISPPYGVAVLVKNAASLIKKLLKNYKASSTERFESLRIILNVLAISINTKLMGDWSQQEINKYLVSIIRNNDKDYYKINDALWSYIITVDGLLSQSAFLCGVRSHIVRPPGAQIHEYRIGNTRSGHTIDKPIVFLLDAISDLTHDEKTDYCVDLVENNSSVVLDLNGIKEKYISILKKIYYNKMTSLGQYVAPPTTDPQPEIEGEPIDGGAWPAATAPNLANNMNELILDMTTPYEKDTVKVYIDKDRELFRNSNDTLKMGERLLDSEKYPGNDFNYPEVNDSNTFFTYNTFTDDDVDVYKKIMKDDGTSVLKKLKDFIRAKKMKNYQNSIIQYIEEIKRKFDDFLTKYTAGGDSNYESNKFYLTNGNNQQSARKVKMSDVDIETYNKILSEIHNYNSSIDKESVDKEILSMINHLGKAMFLFTNIQYITGVGLFDASMTMTPRDKAEGWFKKVSGADENIYINSRGGKPSPAICRDMAPEIPVIVHPMYYPLIMDLDEFKKLPEAQIQQLRLLPETVIGGPKARSNRWTGKIFDIPKPPQRPDGIALYNGKHSIYFDRQKKHNNETIFYNLLFSENMSTSYNLITVPGDNVFDGGYVDVVMDSFLYVDTDLSDTHFIQILNKIKENWCYMFSLANLLDKFFDNVDEVVNLVVNEPTAECTLSSNCPDTVGLIEPLVDSLDETQSKQEQLKGLASGIKCGCWNVKENKKKEITVKAEAGPHPVHSNFLTYKNIYHPSIFGNPKGSEEQLTQLEVTASKALEIMGPLINSEDFDEEDIKTILNFCGIFQDGDEKYSVDLKKYKQQFEFYQGIQDVHESNYRSADYSRLQLKLLRSYLYYKKYLIGLHDGVAVLDLIKFTNDVLEFRKKVEGSDGNRKHILFPQAPPLAPGSAPGPAAPLAPATLDNTNNIVYIFLKELLSLSKDYSEADFIDNKDKFNGIAIDKSKNDEVETFLKLHFRLYEVFGTLLHSEINEIMKKIINTATTEALSQEEKDLLYTELLIKYLLI